MARPISGDAIDRRTLRTLYGDHQALDVLLSPRLGIVRVAAHVMLTPIFACINNNLATVRSQIVGNRRTLILHLSPEARVLPTVIRVLWLLMYVTSVAGRAVLAPYPRWLVEFLHPEHATTQATSAAMVHKTQTPAEDET